MSEYEPIEIDELVAWRRTAPRLGRVWHSRVLRMLRTIDRQSSDLRAGLRAREQLVSDAAHERDVAAGLDTALRGALDELSILRGDLAGYRAAADRNLTAAHYWRGRAHQAGGVDDPTMELGPGRASHLTSPPTPHDNYATGGVFSPSANRTFPGAHR